MIPILYAIRKILPAKSRILTLFSSESGGTNNDMTRRIKSDP
ncbi:hypothetical protein [Leptospira ainazelensis]|nr:hypothetical protein [Leptospira ainazelensis]